MCMWKYGKAMGEQARASMSMHGLYEGLTIRDFLRLEPLFLDSLERLIPCSRIRMMPPGHLCSMPRPEGMSDRQHARAIEALGAGLPFLDRIGRFLVLPCPLSSGGKEVFLFEGVTPEIGVEESARWLPVLSEHVPLRLMELKRGALYAVDGLPPYCIHTIRHEGACRSVPFCVIEVGRSGKDGVGKGRRSGMRPDSACFSMGEVLRCQVEWIGTSGCVSWFALDCADPIHVQRGLRRMMRRRGGFSALYERVLIHVIEPGIGLEDLLAEMDALRTWASLTGSRVFSTQDARDLSERLGMPDPSAWEAISRDFPLRRIRAAAYVHPISQGMDVHGGEEWRIFRVGPSSAFVLSGSHMSGKDSGEACKASLMDRLVSRLPEAPTMGLAVRRFLPAGIRDPLLGAVSAFLHARLLGKGTCVLFDDITANVLGDEYFSWGDVEGARRIYAMGARLNPENQKLLNSLGVACADLGRKKEALDAFSRASLLAADAYMAFYNASGIHLEMGCLDKAETAARKAVELRPGDPFLVMRLAEVLAEAGRVEEAEVLLEETEDSPDIPAAWYRLKGRILLARPERWHDAKSALQEVLRRNPADAEAMALLARGFFDREGDLQTAERLSRACRSTNNGRTQKVSSSGWSESCHLRGVDKQKKAMVTT